MTLINLFAVAAGRVDLGAMDGAFIASPAKICGLVLSANVEWL